MATGKVSYSEQENGRVPRVGQPTGGRLRALLFPGSGRGFGFICKFLTEKLKYYATKFDTRCTIQTIRQSGEFRADWYLYVYPDVAKAKLDPIEHYVRHGASEGRNPSPDFDTNGYLADHPGLARSGINPFLAYIMIRQGVENDADTAQPAHNEQDPKAVFAPPGLIAGTDLWSPDRPRQCSRLERGLCIVRTQGKRLLLLREALESIGAQGGLLTPCVVVHGTEETMAEITNYIRPSCPDAIFLLAPDLNKTRGYPLNVGLDYLCSQAEQFQFFCWLDDDDIYYPSFAGRLRQAMALTGADVVSCRANSRQPWLPAKPAYQPLPDAVLLRGNFIPNNCYIARTEILVRSGIRAVENIHYLDDWDFLISLMEAGARFHFLNEMHSEIRIIGDGSRLEKYYPEHYLECEARVMEHARAAAKTLGARYFYRSIAEFSFASRPPLSEAEWALIKATQNLFKENTESIDADQ